MNIIRELKIAYAQFIHTRECKRVDAYARRRDDYDVRVHIALQSRECIACNALIRAIDANAITRAF